MAVVTITYRRRLRQRRATVRTDRPDLTVHEIWRAQRDGHGIWVDDSDPTYITADRVTHAAITF